MTTLEIIAGSVLIFSCLVIVIAAMLQSSKGDGLTSAIMGSGGPSTREKGRTSDQKLATLTAILAVVFFIVTIGVNIVVIISKTAA